MKKLPEGWKEVTLGEILEYEQPTDYIVGNEEYNDEYKTPVLTAGKSFILGYTNEKEGVYNKLPVIIFDDFTTASKYVTFPFKVKSSAMKLLTPKTNNVNLKYIFWLMQTIKVNSFSHKRYYLSKYQHIKIPLPPLSTQKKIVSILEKAEQVKEWRKEVDTLTNDFLKAVFVEMFGDPGKNPKKWPIYKIEQVALDKKGSIRMGPFGSQLKKHELVKEGIKVLWIENIVDNKFNPEGTKYITKEKYEQLKGFTVEPGDIIITMMGTIGRVEIVPDIGVSIISSHLLMIKVNMKLCNPIYLKTIIMSPFVQNQFKEASHGAIMSGLNGGIIKSTKIILPPLHLQQKFASIVKEVEAMKEHQEHSKEQLDNLFNVLMQKAFKGELVV